MGYLILSFCIASLITFSAIPVILVIATEKKLYDMPDDRKIHLNPISSLGGVGIFAGFLFTLLIMWPNATITGKVDASIQFIAAACLIIFFLGLKDDILVLGPLKKLIGQIIAAWIIIYKCKFVIASFYGVFGVNGIPNALQLGVSYFAIILIVNAYNLIDGVDGLSGNLSFISSIFFALYFYNYGPSNFPYAITAAALAGSLGAFLIFNHHPAKIFMGDTGSLLIGLVLSILLIKFINLAAINDEVTFANNIFINAGPVLGLSILSVPLFDTARVFGLRILKGRSPFSPDRNHIHHIFLDKGYTHNRITFILSIASIFLMLVAYFSVIYFTPTLSLIVLILTTTCLFLMAYYWPNSKRIKGEIIEETNSRIVNMARDAVL